MKKFGIYYEEPDDNKGGFETPEGKEFLSKFTPPSVIPVKEGEEKPEAKPEEKLEEKKVVQPEEKHKQGSFLKQQIEDKKKAEKERDEANVELKKYKETEIPSLNTKIEDLQKKIDSGDFSSTKEKEFQDRIDKLTTEKESKTKELEDELSKTRQRLEYHDFRESSEFQGKYLVPMGNTIKRLQEIVAGNQSKEYLLGQALNANTSVLQARTEGERAQYAEQRDILLDKLNEDLPSATQRRLTQNFEQFISLSESQAIALSQWEQTRNNLAQESRTNAQESAKKVLKTWQNEFDALEEEFEVDTKLSEDEEKALKVAKIEYEPDEVDKEISKVLTGRASIQEACRVLRYGRAYKTVKARNQILETRIKELTDTVNKLKGSKGSGGGNNETSRETKAGQKNENGEVVNSEGQDRAKWMKKFAPH